jgi:alpha-tubulin suppressor-like RCC1 family protein
VPFRVGVCVVMKKLLGLSFFVVTALSLLAAPTQWSGNGHFYEVVNTRSSWLNASNAATVAGGYLATPTSTDENAFVLSLLTNTCTLTPNAWIGGFQPDGSTEPDGGWQWVTGEPWATTFWASGEPNNSGSESHLVMYSSDGTWNDSADGDVSDKAYIVEYETMPLASQTIGLQNAFSFCAPNMASDTTFQWYLNGSAISDATDACFSGASAQIGDAGSYYVVAQNSDGTFTSSTAVLTVTDPSIITHPVNTLATAGSEVTLTASAASASVLTYQWQKNGFDVSGATNATLSLHNASVSDSGLYRLVVSNELGIAYSRNARLRVCVPGTVRAWGNFSVDPNFHLTNAVDVKLVNTAGYTHAVALNADGTLLTWGNYYHYYLDASDISNAVDVACGDAATYILQRDGSVVMRSLNFTPCLVEGISNAVAIAAYSAHVVVLCGDGHVEDLWWQGYPATNVPTDLSNVVALAAGNSHSLALKNDGTVVGWGTAYNGELDIPAAATNIVSIAAGQDTSYAINADGSALQWGYNNSPSITLTNAQSISATELSAAAILKDGTLYSWGGFDQTPTKGWSNIVAAAITGDAGLAISTTPAINNAFGPVGLIVGNSYQLDVVATGTGNLTYQWQHNGINIAGANSPSFLLVNVTDADAGDYRCIVSNENGSVVSTVATITVFNHPPNDDFANRTAFLGTTMTGSNNYATAEASEPNPGTSYTVWWKWTAPKTEWVSFDTDGSALDLYLSVYTNAPSAHTVDKLLLVDQNAFFDNPSGFTGSRVTFHAKAGVEYDIQLSSYPWWWASQGAVQLNLHEQVPTFKQLKGTYTGLISDGAWWNGYGLTQSDSGPISIHVAPSGSYSGSVTIDGDVLSLNGKFAPNGRATNTISRAKQGKSTVTLTMDFGFSRWTNYINGSLATSDSWAVNFVAKLAPFSGTVLNNMYNGTYSFLLPPQNWNYQWNGNASTNVPPGYGFMSVVNDKTGKVTYSGTLSDGTTFKQTTPICWDGTFPIWIPLNKTKYSAENTITHAVKTQTRYAGSVIGWGNLTNRAPTGNYRWLKPAVIGDAYYPEGFWSWGYFQAAQYTPPPAGTSFLPGSETIYLQNGHLNANLSTPVGITPGNAIVVLGANTYSLIATFNSTNGVVTGTFKNPAAGNAKTKFSGMIYYNGIFGAFKGTDEYGLFQLSP